MSLLLVVENQPDLRPLYFADDDFTIDELKHVLKLCRRRAAPGPLGVTNQAEKIWMISFFLWVRAPIKTFGRLQWYQMTGGVRRLTRS